jgi:methyltransferase (TIGR00027 family)
VIDGKPSRTARFVAATRALGALLPDGAQLMDDTYGARVAGAGVARLVAWSRRAPSLRPFLRAAAAPMLPMIAYMQVRTRLIDDVVRRFAGFGGTQLVLLGAGFDARAARLADVLGDSRVFEIDHPATQALKRARFGDLRVTFVPWNFERDPMSTLAARLASLGHDATRPTLTIWEGVTMYLHEPAIAETVAAVRAWSAPGSQLCFSYVDRRQIERPRLATRLVTATVRAWGEPWRFGWEPRALGGWLAAHGYRLVSDEEVGAAGRRLLPRRFAMLLRRTGDRHIAVAEPSTSPR